MDERHEAMISRLDRLERANRRMKVISFAILVAVVGIGASQGSGPAVFRAQRFQVVDDNGNVLADLGKFGANQEVSLLIYDHHGVLRTFTGVSGVLASADNSGFTDWDSSGVIRSFSGSLGSGPFVGSSGQLVYDKNGFVRTGANIDYLNNFAGTFTDDPSGKNRVALGTPQSGSKYVFLNLNDVNQQFRAGMSADFDSSGGEGTFLVDKNNVFRAGLTVDNGCCGGTGNDLLFFNNASNFGTGNFYSLGGGGVYTTFDGSSFFNVTGHLP